MTPEQQAEFDAKWAKIVAEASAFYGSECLAECMLEECPESFEDCID